jgi:S1-C subfamily serine protease
VVGGAKFVKIKLAQGHSSVGEVLRIDTVRDVALIKTDLTSVVSLAVRSNAPQVGEEVYAIGSPLGSELSGTLTKGVVSANRTVDNVNYIQSDVSINPGSSGGPLLDSQGQVLGLTQLKAANGISLFIPIKEALERLNIKLN